MALNRVSVLAVDDDPDFVKLSATHLERELDSIEVLTATNTSDALEQYSDHDIDCIVSDYEMPGMDGISLLQEIRKLDEELPFILFTGKGSEEVASDAISAGVTNYLQKGHGADKFELLSNKVCNGVAKYRTEREHQLVIERMTDAIIEVDEDCQLTTINHSAEAINGMDADEVLGRNVLSVFPDAVDTRIYEVCRRVMDTGDSTMIEEYYEPLQTWFEVHVYPGAYEGLSIYFRELNSREECTNLRQ